MQTIPVKPEDEALLFSIYEASREEEMRLWNWGPEETRAFLSLQFRLQQQSYRMQYPSAEHLIVMHNGEQAGQVRIHRSDEELRLVDLSLLPSCRNLGIGTRILRGLQKEAKAGGRPLKLHVLENSRAVRLYERLGFRSCGQESSPYRQMMWPTES